MTSMTDLCQSPILVYPKLVTLDQVQPLWGKIKVTKERQTKHFWVKAKLLYVKLSCCDCFAN